MYKLYTDMLKRGIVFDNLEAAEERANVMISNNNNGFRSIVIESDEFDGCLVAKESNNWEFEYQN